MDIKELDSKLAEKRSQRQTLTDRAMKSQSIEHIRAINKEIEVVNAEIAELEEIRSGILENNNKGIPENAKRVNDEVVRAAYGGNKSFSMTADNVGAPEVKSSFALRSDETLFSRLPAGERKSLDLGKYVRGVVTGDWTNAHEERSAINTTASGVLIPSVLSANVIDKARNLSLFTAAGVPIVPMLSNNLTVARVANDPEFKFKEELAESEDSSFSLDSVILNAKTAYGYAYVSLEAIKSAQNLTEILYQVFSQAFAVMCDKGMLYGQSDGQGGYDSFAPSGILNDPDINVVEAHNHWYDDFVRAIYKIKRANGIPTTIALNAATDEQLALCKDANGQVIEIPKIITELDKILSNQLKEDENLGSDALVFDPNAMMIGVQNNISIRIIQDSDYCIKHGAVGFQIYAMLDCAVVQPKHITKITGLKDNFSLHEHDDDNSEQNNG